jgi:hypothetical protein
MQRWGRPAILGLAVFLAVASAAWAQPKAPHLGYVYPAGGRQGTTFLITVGGQYLDEVVRLRFSGAGIQAKPRTDIRPLTMKETGELRERLDKIREKRDAASRKETAELQRKLSAALTRQLRTQTMPAIAETVTFEAALAPDAKPGERELRLETPMGISNRLTFCVGTEPEFHEKEPALTVLPDPRDPVLSRPPRLETDITLPAIVNGQIIPHEPEVLRYGQDRFTPGDVDRFRFEARKGQQLVAKAAARELMPYLADAVPGWFQATLALYDARGKEVAYDDDYRFHPDPVLFYKIPQDGPYVLEIKDAIYRGRPDFVYRLAVGELPFVTSIFPLGGPAGRQTTVELKGWNLPADRLTMDARQKAPGIYPLSVNKGDMTSNSVPFAVDTLPECLEQEPNDSRQTAQAVKLPVIVNGRIDRPGDRDVFRFEGQAGEQIVAEVYARRLDSPLDSLLELTDAAGKRLAFNDDHEDKADALNTHQADSLIQFTLPAQGTYYLHLGDAQHEGGPEYAYRLRISRPRPDFALRVVPSCINAPGGRVIPISVVALRKDGFSDAIALSLKDAPEGFSLGGGRVPSGTDQVRVTLAVPFIETDEPLHLCLEGRASIGGKEVIRTAVPADDMMQAFAYKHLVPAQDLTIAVVNPYQRRNAGAGTGNNSPAARPAGAGRRFYQSAVAILGEMPVKLPAGGTAELRIRAPNTVSSRSEVQLELSDPPEGITIDKVSRTDNGVAIVLRSDARKAKPGLQGNLIAIAIRKETVTNKDGKSRDQRTPMGALPAIPFEVVQP